MAGRLQFVLLLILPYVVSAQRELDKRKDGLLVFESSHGIDNAYFILSPVKKFDSLAVGVDTVSAFWVGYDFGGHVDLIEEFRKDITRQIGFDSATYLIASKNDDGISYEDSVTNFSRFGTIRYLTQDGYSLAPSFKTIFIQDKRVVLRVTAYQRIENFFIEQKNK